MDEVEARHELDQSKKREMFNAPRMTTEDWKAMIAEDDDFIARINRGESVLNQLVPFV